MTKEILYIEKLDPEQTPESLQSPGMDLYMVQARHEGFRYRTFVNVNPELAEDWESFETFMRDCIIRQIEKYVPIETFPYYWRVKTRFADRKGSPCKVLARGKKNTILVEFVDGFKTSTSGNYIRKRVVK